MKSAAGSQSPITILCTGGATGYLASFISEAINEYNKDRIKIQYWPTSRNLHQVLKPNDPNTPITFRFQNSEEVSKASKTLLELKPDVIIHAAALTSLGKCELNADVAMESNCPHGLLDAIELAEKDSGSSWRLGRFIYISTDQVYQGDPDAIGRVSVPSLPSSFISTLIGKENEEQTLWPAIPPDNLLPPVNIYGRSKLAFESLLMKRRQQSPGDSVVLRASNMIGPVSPTTGDGRFLQWLESALSIAPDAEKISLFVDEYRNFVYVRDVARAILGISLSSAERLKPVYNLGGNINLSRHEFGRVVCSVKGFPFEKCNILEKKRADIVGAAYESPLDIGMDSYALERDLMDFAFTPMDVALKESLSPT